MLREDVETAIHAGLYREARVLLAGLRGDEPSPDDEAVADAYESDILVHLVRYEDARSLLSRHIRPERESELAPATRALLRLVHGRLWFAAGDYPQAIARYRSGLDEAAGTSDEAGALRRRLWAGLAEAFLFIHQPELAEDAIERIAMDLVGASDRLVSGLERRMRAQLDLQRAELDAAKRGALEALERLAPFALERAITHNLVANIAHEIGDSELRLHHREAALAAVQETENRRWLGRLHHNLGDTLVQSGRLEEARRVLIPWDKKSRRYHNLFERGTHHATVGELEYLSGQFARAVELYALACEELEAYPGLQGETLYLMAQALGAAGRSEEALSCLMRALDLAQRTQRGTLQRLARVAIAEHQLEHSGPDAAQVVLNELQRIAEGTPSLPVTMHLRRVQGRIDAARGALDRAAVLLERSRAIALAMDAPAPAGRARIFLAEVEALRGNPEDAVRVLEEARRELHVQGIHALDSELGRAAEGVHTPSLPPPPPRAGESDTRSTVLGAHVLELLDAGESSGTVARALAAALADVGIHASLVDGHSTGPGEVLMIGRALLELDRLPESVEAQALVALARRLCGGALSGAFRPAFGGEVPREVGLVYAGEALRSLVAQLRRLRGSTLPVLITGESGTGKELVARAVHDLSARAGGPFVPVSCASLPATLIASSLFGHKRGAFTGAERDHAGLVRTAAGGTLFLDEVGEVPLDVQPQLLRFLENGEVLAIGGERPERIDVRVVAATHRDLAAMVHAGTFREDLFYRLEVLHLHIPPLRERPEDVPVLVAHFLRTVNAKLEAPVRIQQDAVALLAEQPLPGNARQLLHLVERLAIAVGAGGAIRRSHVEAELGQGAAPPGRSGAAMPAVDEQTRPLQEALGAYERELIERALQRAGSVAAAAKLLGISRSTLYDRMERLQISRA